MAELMSMLPDEVPQGELNADEQDSLQVGQQMRAEEENLLAGKYKSAEELEAAYVELQKKLGQNTEEQPTESEEPAQESSENFLDTLWQEATTEYTDDTMKKLEGMSSRDVADMYLNYRNNVEQSAPAQMSDQDVSNLKSMVGGEENYSNMLGWAGQNLPEGDIDMYDKVMDSGDPLAAYFAVQALAYRYQDAVGTEGNLLSGKAAARTDNQFKSQAQLVQAMSDPRYDTDPSYREEIMTKLSNSGQLF